MNEQQIKTYLQGMTHEDEPCVNVLGKALLEYIGQHPEIDDLPAFMRAMLDGIIDTASHFRSRL